MTWGKNIVVGGLAAASGVFGYVMGRSKSIRGVSLTLMAVSLMLYLPKGCELLDKHMARKAEIEKYKIIREYKKDSIEDIISLEKLKRDSVYLKYDLLVQNAEKKYDALVYQTENKINKVNNNMIYQKNNLNTFYEEMLNEMKEFKNCMGEYYVNQKDKSKNNGK